MKQNIRLSVRLRMADADDGWENADGKMQIESVDWKKYKNLEASPEWVETALSGSA